MGQDIDFTQGGYGGEAIEETFKSFTQQHMEYWWLFREILRAIQAKPTKPTDKCFWQRADNTPLSDEEWKDLISVSLTSYMVYTGLADALAFFEELKFELTRSTIVDERIMQVRRIWKAMYSSLYSSLNALCNLVCVVVAQKLRLKPQPKPRIPPEPWNYSVSDTLQFTKDPKFHSINIPLKRCKSLMIIRNQLDHWGLIWSCIDQGKFFIDSNIEKGRIVLDPSNVKYDLDVIQRAEDDLINFAQDFNIIYKAMAIPGGYLDTYLRDKGWVIDYSDFGHPHNGQRPKPNTSP